MDRTRPNFYHSSMDELIVLLDGKFSNLLRPSVVTTINGNELVKVTGSITAIIQYHLVQNADGLDEKYEGTFHNYVVRGQLDGQQPVHISQDAVYESHSYKGKQGDSSLHFGWIYQINHDKYIEQIRDAVTPGLQISTQPYDISEHFLFTRAGMDSNYVANYFIGGDGYGGAYEDHNVVTYRYNTGYFGGDG